VVDSREIRAADAERDALAAELREHMVAGRLTQDEFEERLEKAYGASTRGELSELKRDLPISPAAARAEIAKRRAHLRRRLLQEGSGGLTASGVCVAIWVLSGANGSFWPAWVIFFSLLPMLRDLWRLFGPAPDLEGLEKRLDRRRRHDEDHHLERSRSRQNRHGRRDSRSGGGPPPPAPPQNPSPPGLAP
jgi:hypothetical protein